MQVWELWQLDIHTMLDENIVVELPSNTVEMCIDHWLVLSMFVNVVFVEPHNYPTTPTTCKLLLLRRGVSSWHWLIVSRHERVGFVGSSFKFFLTQSTHHTPQHILHRRRSFFTLSCCRSLHSINTQAMQARPFQKFVDALWDMSLIPLGSHMNLWPFKLLSKRQRTVSMSPQFKGMLCRKPCSFPTTVVVVRHFCMCQGRDAHFFRTAVIQYPIHLSTHCWVIKLNATKQPN